MPKKPHSRNQYLHILKNLDGFLHHALIFSFHFALFSLIRTLNKILTFREKSNKNLFFLSLNRTLDKALQLDYENKSKLSFCIVLAYSYLCTQN